MTRKKIAVGVGGRFHADRMVSALISLGQDARLFTSYPANKFPGIPKELVCSTLYPELVFRFCRATGKDKAGSNFKMTFFGRALANQLAKKNWDIFLGWSSFSLESLQRRVAPRQILIRDSCHIKFQMDLLQEESQKLGISFFRDQVAEEREIIEYEIADEIFVLSEFAKKSFIVNGIPEKKLRILPLGVDTNLFYPSPTKKQNPPLRVVYFGSLSVRKGVQYLLEAVSRFESQPVEFHFIGDIEPELQTWFRKTEKIKLYVSMQQKELAKVLREMDVFVFPTLEDGFGQTLIQAMASGLAPIFTSNSGASELVSSTEGIRVPPQNTDALVEAINYLLLNSERLEDFKLRAVQKAKLIHWGIYQNKLSDLLL